jgi:[ribosomal protein S5]-alanine N-acetyltransferase
MKTNRLELLPHPPEHLLALIESPAAYQRAVGVRPAEGLRDFVVGPEVSPDFLARLNSKSGQDPWVGGAWVDGFVVVQLVERDAIGLASFKGPPTDDGMVEIAYGIVPLHQKRGYATEAAQGLLEYDFASGQLCMVIAHRLPEPNASTIVLGKLGLKQVGQAIDPEDGPVSRWEKARDAR